jgi:hypothetical protein
VTNPPTGIEAGALDIGQPDSAHLTAGATRSFKFVIALSRGIAAFHFGPTGLGVPEYRFSLIQIYGINLIHLIRLVPLWLLCLISDSQKNPWVPIAIGDILEGPFNPSMFSRHLSWTESNATRHPQTAGSRHNNGVFSDEESVSFFPAHIRVNGINH